LETDTKRNKLILSQRLAVQEEKAAQREKILSTLESGQVVTGEVVRIADFGAFIDLGGLDGLFPISEISWERVSTSIRCTQSRPDGHNQSPQSRPRERAISA
jgi:small subunit ribosomal protein S1